MYYAEREGFEPSAHCYARDFQSRFRNRAGPSK